MNRQHKQQQLVVIVSICAAAFLLATLIPLSWVRTGTSFLSYPILKSAHALSQAIDTLRVGSRDRLIIAQALTSAEREIDNLKMQAHEIHQSVHLYNEIAELVEFKKRFAGAPALIAGIARKEINTARHQLILDVGSTSGVAVGMIAVYNHLLVGRVIEVQPLYCRLALISDASVSVAAICMNTKTTGIVRGTNGSELQLLYVDHLSHLEMSDQVVSSGEGLLFPRGFLLGTIVSDTIVGIYHHTSLKPVLDASKLTHVLLMNMVDLKPQFEVVIATLPAAIEQPSAVEQKKLRERKRRSESVQVEIPQPVMPVPEAPEQEQVQQMPSAESQSE